MLIPDLSFSTRRLSVSSLSVVILALSAALLAGIIPAAHAEGPFPGPCPVNTTPPPNSVPCLNISPQTQSNLAPGSSVTVSVTTTNLPTFSGWDLAIKTNNAVLNPQSLSVVETFGGTFQSTTNCINGSGLGCSGNDGAGIAHSAGFSFGANDAGNVTLFTITYRVVSGPTTDITYANSPSEPSSVTDPSGFTLVDCGATPNQCLTGSAAVASPTLVSVVQGSGGAIYSSTFLGTWSAWQSLSGTSNFAPGLCSSGPGNVELVVTGTDGQLYHKSFSSGAWSAAWDVAGGAITGQPGCAVLNGALYVVARAPDVPGSLWTNHRSLPSGAWSAWGYLAGASPNTPVLVATPGMNRLDLIVTGVDHRIWHASAPNGVFTLNSAAIWDTPAGGTVAAPAAVSDGTSLHVVVAGQDGGVWYNSLTLSSTTWGAWRYLNGGTTTSAPALALDSAGTLHIIIRGQNGGIYHDTKPSGGVPGTTWDSASGGLASDAPAANAVGTSLVVLVRGSDNGLYFNTLTGTTWGSWASANGASNATPAVANL